MFGTVDFKEGTVLEKKSSIYGRIIKSFRKINTNLKAG
jgi:hypothetical protein